MQAKDTENEGEDEGEGEEDQAADPREQRLLKRLPAAFVHALVGVRVGQCGGAAEDVAVQDVDIRVHPFRRKILGRD